MVVDDSGKAPPLPAFDPFFIIGTGGSGLTTALDIFAELGFPTLSGMDSVQLPALVPMLGQGQLPFALAFRLRPEEDPEAAARRIAIVRQAVPNLKILALDAPEDVLVQRYLDSDKRHAFEVETPGLREAITLEKRRFLAIKVLKDYSIDTSTTTPPELTQKIRRILDLPIHHGEFTVYITTFGFKYGVPTDAELVFDMRFMTNPFYDTALRPLTGMDQPVRDFIFNLEHARRFFEQWSGLIAEMLPLYQEQGKSRLTVAVGCTGGKHRSVCMGEALAENLRQRFPKSRIVIRHREMLRWESPAIESEARQSACPPVP